MILNLVNVILLGMGSDMQAGNLSPHCSDWSLILCNSLSHPNSF